MNNYITKFSIEKLILVDKNKADFIYNISSDPISNAFRNIMDSLNALSDRTREAYSAFELYIEHFNQEVGNVE